MNIIKKFLLFTWGLLKGVFWIAVGLAFLKIYFNRNKDNIWGNLYRMSPTCGRQGGNNEMVQRGLNGTIYLIIGFLGIIAGLIALFFGFRLKGVGY